MSNDVKEQVSAWAYLKELPCEREEFLFVADERDDREILGIFNYVCQEKKCRIECFYNKITGDFILRRIFGLNEYNDISFITPKLAIFEILLQEKLFDVINEMSFFANAPVCMSLQRKGITDWEFKEFLPEVLHDFELYITPKTPMRLINGSYIVIDYSNFVSQAQFVVYYNELRSEFYAEKKVKGIVETTNCMDAKNIKELEKKLVDLPEILQGFAK